MRPIIEYFANRPLICNVIIFFVLLSGVLTWQKIGKEEMPEFESPWLRISVAYPGAAAADVEQLVVKPIESQLVGVNGVDEVRSSASFGSASIRVGFRGKGEELKETIQELKDAVDRADLPDGVRNDPVYRQWKTSEKAIIDMAIYMDGKTTLGVEDRRELQKYALAFKNRLLDLPEISGVGGSGYLRPELRIKVDPKKLRRYEITMEELRTAVVRQNIRLPIGSMVDRLESSVTIQSPLETKESLENVIVRSTFGRQIIRLGDVAAIEDGFEKETSITKVFGHQGIIFTVQKGGDTDILTAQKAVMEFVTKYQKTLVNSPIRIAPMDDESYDVRNRLRIIATNGLLGFSLIILALFVFMDLRSGFWVALGIPFSLAVTLVAANLLGFTVNNMTMSGIIIVIGIVVDDAIIVAENIDRHLRSGEGGDRGALEGTYEVLKPILASVLTTCAAFLPMYYFQGTFGQFVKYLPTIIILMLFASLFESILILPSHMSHKMHIPFLSSLVSKMSLVPIRRRGLEFSERAYRGFIGIALKLRIVVVLVFILGLFGAYKLFRADMKFVMFPREESSQIAVRVKAKPGINKYEMAEKISEIEALFLEDDRGVVTAVRSSIGVSRRGGQVKENEGTVRVEIIPPGEREIPLKKLMASWEAAAKELEGFEEVRFLKRHWGYGSGSPIEVQIQENGDENRRAIVDTIKTELEKLPYLKNVELEKPLSKDEFTLRLKPVEVNRLGVDVAQLARSLRAYVEGEIIYTITSGEEEIDVRFTGVDSTKSGIDEILSLKIGNKKGYLVPIADLVTVDKAVKPVSIGRINYRRTTSVYADFADDVETTPLEVANYLEADVFPKLMGRYPTAQLEFAGEVRDSRESMSDFAMALGLALVLIYGILVMLFNSLVTPLLIGAVIPFGLIGVILAFWSHGLTQYGFFSVVGTVGMIGVVVNDAIVMVAKLEGSGAFQRRNGDFMREITAIASTRLRPIVLTTITTAAGLLPTAYGVGGYDSMLAEMMLAMAWGLIFATLITLVLLPCLYSFFVQLRSLFSRFVREEAIYGQGAVSGETAAGGTVDG